MQLNRPLSTVTPTLDGDVLAVLAAADVTFTISQINRILPDVSGEGIRKVLTRLTEQGVVLHDQVGRTHTFRFNAEHLAAQPIRELANLANTLLDRLDRYLAEWLEKAAYAAVFGSAMTGRMRLDSDIDIFLVRSSAPEPVAPGDDSQVWEQQVADLATAVTAWTGNDARVVEYTEQDLHTAIAAGEPLLREVARDGRTVAGPPGWLKTQLRTTNRHRPMAARS
ncbi:nucleotidyltransferase domain-containing protein [Mycobacterium sp. OTB74]|uniref:nucleotidyltransferase domain-containing protein n=1 Tax=Mycobacterium sp. OTB74 TaxID=1853452 RepID=UPI002472F3F5|nr:nucleotidyltransferase domain-containing protein [Mycobacterium sp. OTB74]MDH6245487.1 putative transcriptional regulator [Mycobacterium sp. OTB74]